MKIIKYKVESNDFGKIKAIFLDCISKYINQSHISNYYGIYIFPIMSALINIYECQNIERRRAGKP